MVPDWLVYPRNPSIPWTCIKRVNDMLRDVLYYEFLLTLFSTDCSRSSYLPLGLLRALDEGSMADSILRVVALNLLQQLAGKCIQFYSHGLLAL